MEGGGVGYLPLDDASDRREGSDVVVLAAVVDRARDDCVVSDCEIERDMGGSGAGLWSFHFGWI